MDGCGAEKIETTTENTESTEKTEKETERPTSNENQTAKNCLTTLQSY
jgi:hypothetical protein